MSGVCRPIFIVGTGRCGSTIFHKIWTHHPRVAFLTGLCRLYPDRPEYNRWALRCMDLPGLGRVARRRFQPGEYYEFWDRYAMGFGDPCRDLVADDVQPNKASHITDAMGRMLTPSRDRLLVKLTGWPRIGYLARVFPDALFVHLIRDGRAVANSLVNVDWWQGWRGPENWTRGPLSPRHRDEWERSDRSFVVLAGIEWKILMDAFEQARTLVPPSQYLAVRYRDFIGDPTGTFARVLEFCGLDFPDRFRRDIARFRVEDCNTKWQTQLTPRQQEWLRDCLKDALPRYGYDPDEGIARERSGSPDPFPHAGGAPPLPGRLPPRGSLYD